MNLVVKEFVASNKGNGVLVLSEFAGAADELKDTILVNPYDMERFVDGIKDALEMKESERKSIMGKLRKKVEEHDVYWWLDYFFDEWGKLY